MENFSGILRGSEKSGNDIETLIPDSEHKRALKTCIDIPEQKPSFSLPINDVGICRKTVWINLPQGKIPFETEVKVDLPSSIRGIHMSRIEKAIAGLYNKNFVDIAEYAENLVKFVQIGQKCSKAFVKLSGRIPMLQKTPATRLSSMDSIKICAIAEIMKRKESVCKILTGAGLNHITACPCTQAYNHVLSGKSDWMPLPTHTQRSTTWLTIERDMDRPSYEELILCLKSSLHSTYDLLKRPDEAELVLLAHNAPQFVEDTARETAKEVGIRFGDFLPESVFVKIESYSLESIHNHDVQCSIKTTMGEILKVITV